MHAPVNHVGVKSHARRKPPRDLSDWLMEAAILTVVVSIGALAVAYGVLLIFV